MQLWLLHHIKFRSLILYKKKHEIDAHVLNSTQSAIYTKEFLNSPLSLAPLLWPFPILKTDKIISSFAFNLPSF